SGSVIAVLRLTAETISTCYSYGIAVKNVSRDKKRLIDQLFGLQKVLETVRRLVEDDETVAASRLPALNELLLRCSGDLQTLNASLERDLGRKGRIQALIWPLKESEVNKTLDKLGKFQDLLTTAMDIYNWLAAPDHESKHRNACSVRQETTGSWFVEGDHFQEWRETPHSFLWLHGIRASTIIEELLRHCRSDASLAVAFFYLDFNNKDTPTDAVLRSLIEQLSVQCATIPNALETLVSKHAGAGRSAAQEELMATLKSIIGSFRAVYIVFDALDEFPERSRFLKLIREIHQWEFDKLHLLATSRKERDIEETLNALTSHEVPMDESLVDGDIRVHVSRTLEDDFSTCSAEEKEMMKITLIRGARGMFRWVVCQLESLRKCRTPAALEKALMCLPTTLYETYDRILATIEEDDRRDAVRLLQWLAFSAEKILSEEAVDVIATDPDAKSGPLFDQCRRLRDPRDILTICSSLVAITMPVAKSQAGERRPAQYNNSEDGNYNDSFDHDRSRLSGSGEVRLAHFSVREYLISERLRTGHATLSYFYFNEKMADVFIARTCLSYLLQFDRHGVVDLNTPSSFPLCRYATVNWMLHAAADPAGDSDDLQKLIIALLEPTNAMYINWLNGLEVNAPDGFYAGTPLQWAAHNGCDITVQLLTEKGAEVNAQGGEHGSALLEAALAGHYSTVQLLLEKGANVNAQGRHYGNALQVAAFRGRDMIVQLLLEKGADVNAQGKSWSALQAAALE
ncbi:hypothetical protein JB92DRAFT_2676131, partial [Gautieria morchelliformis]